MIQKVAKAEVDRKLAVTLIETDRSYFELAARTVDLSVGQIAWMPGLHELAASCVVHRISQDQTSELSESWIDEVETKLRSHQVARARLYFDVFPDSLEATLLKRGYQPRSEVGFLAYLGHPEPPAGFRLCEVRTDAEWSLKHCLHQSAMEGPDGYTNQADLWVDMERRKCASGTMRTYLVRRDDEIVATVGTIVMDGLLRLKNIVVAANMRRQGIGSATVKLLWELAEQQGRRLGVFGVEGGKGSRMYAGAGLCEVTKQYEWSRVLTNDDE